MTIELAYGVKPMSRFNPLDRGNLYQIYRLILLKTMEVVMFQSPRSGKFVSDYSFGCNHVFASTTSFNPLDRGNLYQIKVKRTTGIKRVHVSIP